MDIYQLLPYMGWPVSAIIAVFALLSGCFCLHRIRRQDELIDELQARVARHMKLLNCSSVGMGRKIIDLEKVMEKGDDTGRQVPQRGTRPLDNNLADAASLLAAGVEADEVARRCGISRAEASLMKLMHSKVKSSSAA